MANGIYYNVKAYLGRDFTMEEVRIVKEPNTTNYSIAEWNISDEKAQPTVEQLDALESEATTLESNNQVDSTRKKEYGSWNDQLYEIYHDIDALKARLQTIKTNNPKN